MKELLRFLSHVIRQALLIGRQHERGFAERDRDRERERLRQRERLRRHCRKILRITNRDLQMEKEAESTETEKGRPGGVLESDK